MARFYQIQLGSIYLSADGTNGSIKCKLEVEAADDLLTTVSGITEQSVSGRPKFQTRAWTFGKQIDIKIFKLKEDVFGDLKDLINTAQENNSAFEINMTGTRGDFAGWVRPNPQKPFQSVSFFNDSIFDITLRLITVPEPD